MIEIRKKKVDNWLGISFIHAGELRQYFTQFTKMVGMPTYSYLFFKIIWFVTISVLWKERNGRYFKIWLHTFLSLKK